MREFKDKLYYNLFILPHFYNLGQEGLQKNLKNVISFLIDLQEIIAIDTRHHICHYMPEKAERDILRYQTPPSIKYHEMDFQRQ